jgi:hypothetical protein
MQRVRIFRNVQPRSVDTSKTTNNSDLCNPMTCVADVRCRLKHLDVRVGNALYQLRKWLSTKNRSPRRSTSRHPIATASTAKPPDPMPCALTAILLPESRARTTAICRKPCFLDRAMRAHNSVRTRAVPACGVRSCGVGKRRESGQRHGCRGAVHGAVHGRRLLVESRVQRAACVGAVCGWTRGGLVDAVSSRGEGSGMRGRLGWCGVRWLFQSCCPGGHLRSRAAAAWEYGWVTETFLTVRTFRVARS